MHSLTYTQKKLPAECRQQRCICLYVYIFSPHANSSGQTSGQKVKKCIHYIYTKYPFFIFKKVHTLYIHPKPHFQPAAVLPTAQSLLSHPANLPAAGRNRTNYHQPLLLFHPTRIPTFCGQQN